MKDFYTLVTNVCTECHDTSSSMREIVKTYVNRRYFDVLKRVNYEAINSGYSFNTVAGTSEYVLPDDFGKAVYVLDTTSNQTIDAVDSLRYISENYPAAISTTGLPKRYLIYDDTVRVQPTSASTLSIVSSSSSDTTQKVIIRGVSNSVEVVEEVSLNGTNAVTSANTYTSVKGVSKDGGTYGKITVTAGAVTVAVLSPTVNVSYVKKIMFHYTPESVLTIKMPYIINPTPMVDDHDYPLIPIGDIIETGAKADTLDYKRQFGAASKFESLYEKRIVDYVFNMVNQPNLVHKFNADSYRRHYSV